MRRVNPKRKMLNGLIRGYARERRIEYNRAWFDFKIMFQRTCRIDLDIAMDRYQRQQQKRVNMPTYLEATGHLDDAIRIASQLVGRKV